MHIHILGICGTFMGGIALLARAGGHRVTGSDANVYPPMSTQLAAAGIEVFEGYEPAHLEPHPDCVVIGNALSRGNPAVEYVLERNLPYTSGPQWLSDHVLRERWVLAVAGTHGKTSTSSMLAWILEDAGLEPGFLVGGVPGNFGVSARAGAAPFFVVEADEYDTAFFDKRSKFVHYRPRTVVLNNLEYDHADIFADLEAIKTQFHHLLRSVPGNGLVIAPDGDANLADVLQRGCWTPVEYFSPSPGAAGEGWHAGTGAAPAIGFGAQHEGTLCWTQFGAYNVANALAAIAAARHAGVPVAVALEALGRFAGVKRRMEVRGCVGGVTVYDDFAHHPTAIRSSLEGLRAHVGEQRIVAVLEPRSNTMRMGVHAAQLAPALQPADLAMLFCPAELGWDAAAVLQDLPGKGQGYDSVADIVDAVVAQTRAGDHVLVMSNGGFENIHQRLLDALAAREAADQRGTA